MPATLVQIPDVATALAFRTTASGQSDLFVIGPRTRGRYHPARPAPTCVRLRLRPGAARAAFDIPVHALVDRAVRITDIWGDAGARLTESLIRAAPDTEMVVALMRDAVLARTPAVAPRPPELAVAPRLPGSAVQPVVAMRLPGPAVQPAVAARSPEPVVATRSPEPAVAARLPGLAAQPVVAARLPGLAVPPVFATRLPGPAVVGETGLIGEELLVGESASELLSAAVQSLTTDTRLADTAADLGVSERHLRNLFAREIGLSPKHFARITRLRRVLDRAGTRQWAALADDAGFFDQAHMISDFRAFMGVTPAAYLAGRLPPVSPCAEITRPVL